MIMKKIEKILKSEKAMEIERNILNMTPAAHTKQREKF
jgi:hypothetical protein